MRAGSQRQPRLVDELTAPQEGGRKNALCTVKAWLHRWVNGRMAKRGDDDRCPIFDFL